MCGISAFMGLNARNAGRRYMKATITLEIEFEVDFDIQKEERQILHPAENAYPGCPASLEINDLKIGRCAVGMEIFNRIMGQYQEEIEEACWEESFEDHQAYLVEAADHRRDAMENR